MGYKSYSLSILCYLSDVQVVEALIETNQHVISTESHIVPPDMQDPDVTIELIYELQREDKNGREQRAGRTLDLSGSNAISASTILLADSSPPKPQEG